MKWTKEQIEKTLNEVTQKASEDNDFRQKLKQNPKETIEELSGMSIPDSLKIGIIDQNDVDIVISLPKVDSSELSDADLEQVSGGKRKADSAGEIVCAGLSGGVTVASGGAPIAIALGAASLAGKAGYEEFGSASYAENAELFFSSYAD